MKNPSLLVVAAALLVGIGTACSGDDGDGLRADTESIDSSTPGGDSEAASGNGDGGGNGSDSSGDGDVLGTTRAQLPTNAIDPRTTPVRIDVVRLERNGDLVELGALLVNEIEPADGDSDPQEFQANDLFTDGGTYDASGLGLVDGDSQKLYLPVFDSEGRCLCTDGFGAVEVPPGGTLNMDATFGGVPDGLETVDVRIPGFPTITGVPIR